MNVFALVFFIIVIAGLSFLICWNVYKIIKTVLQRKKDKSLDVKESKRKEKDK